MLLSLDQFQSIWETGQYIVTFDIVLLRNGIDHVGGYNGFTTISLASVYAFRLCRSFDHVIECQYSLVTIHQYPIAFFYL